jgi:hypothetical protein
MKDTHYFAPLTGHKFALNNLNDAAGSNKMRQIASVATEPVLDLLSACWKETEGGSRPKNGLFPGRIFCTQRPHHQ